MRAGPLSVSMDWKALGDFLVPVYRFMLIPAPRPKTRTKQTRGCKGSCGLKKLLLTHGKEMTVDTTELN